MMAATASSELGTIVSDMLAIMERPERRPDFIDSGDLEPHPLAQLIPEMSDGDYSALRDDVAVNGLREPVVLYEGKILDGRHRYRACHEVVRCAHFAEFIGKDPAAYVISLNVRRRHLTASQLAFVALEVEKVYAEEAKKRQGTRTDLEATSSNDLEKVEPIHAARKAAEVVGANHAYLSDAKVIEREAPDLADSVKAGEMTVPAAKREVKRRRPHVAQRTGNAEWYTPAAYIKAAVAVMGGIDLDPASSEMANTVVGAATFYTKADNPLCQEWTGRVWMNPPYATAAIEHFCTKLVMHYRAGDVTEACVMVNNATETKWFQEIGTLAPAICFPKGRVRFWQPGGSRGAPLQGQAIIYLGPSRPEFAEAFRSFGFVAS
jgi:ParB family chromosome partitioning protein